MPFCLLQSGRVVWPADDCNRTDSCKRKLHYLYEASGVHHDQRAGITQEVSSADGLEYLIQHYYSKDPSRPHKPHVHIITPSDPQRRGCQLSLSFSVPIRKVFQELEKKGVTCDTREPSVLRIAPVPLYNSFSNVHHFIQTLSSQ
ncbi:kynureninase-like isoform X3 [Thunnus maccoyii]|uniref:kynureninase-like isoform X3 n=1 Tax=Thunnus maccoyii TaxID=8240 RepID=UPI001C4D0C5F|nr:kynureninase-like isoform X3 [Thunnus maccoyii]